MNITIKLVTFVAVEVNEVFVINVNGSIYMGWRQEETIYRCIDSHGTQGHFDLSSIESNRDVVVIGNTTSYSDVQHYAPWFVGERTQSHTRVGGSAALNALQGVSAMRLAIEAATVTRNIATDL
ncbi:hypothetical protein MQ524_000438 [Salmonella enterica]|nr:hypothetical protein [Salmonella enterica]EIZ8936119.1 hypothetical protein [Salmonella enterica]